MIQFESFSCVGPSKDFPSESSVFAAVQASPMQIIGDQIISTKHMR